jgi:hypothetical protein
MCCLDNKECKRLLELKRNDLLVELPCKIGTPVYIIAYNCDECYDMGTETCLDDKGVCSYPSKYKLMESVFLIHMVDKFNKTVFLDKHHAENEFDKLVEKEKQESV